MPQTRFDQGGSQAPKRAALDWYLVEEFDGVVADGASPVLGADAFDVAIFF